MFRRYAFGLGLVALMAPADGGDPGGGAGGGGGGEPPKAVTIEQVNELVNKALGARDKRFEAKFTETFTGFSKSLEEKLAALAPKTDTSDEPASGKKVDPELVKLRQEQSAMAKRLEASEKARQDAENKSRSQRALGELQASLAKVGVRPEAIGMLIKAWRGDISFDDDGNPLLPFDGGSTTIDAVIGAWAKSDEAKLYLPAPNAGGAGTARNVNGGRVSVPTGKKVTELTDGERESLLG